MNHRALKFLRKLNWPLLTHLASEKSTTNGLYNLSKALADSGVSVQEFRAFRRAQWDDNSKTLPVWATAHLVALKTRTPQQANSRVLQAVADSNDASLLIMASVTLARFGLLLPLQQVLQEFVSLNPGPQECNIMLQAIATLRTSSPATEEMVSRLTAFMKEHTYSLDTTTVNSLLEPRFTTPVIIQLIRRETSFKEMQTSSLNRLLRAYTKLADKASAKETLAQLESRNQHSAVPNQRPSSPTISTSLSDKSSLKRDPRTSLHRPPAPYLSTRTSFAQSPAPPRLQDWTHALHHSVRDMSMSVRRFMRLFHKHVGRTSIHRIQPSTATYTVVMRGLVIRNVPRLALRYWKLLLQSGLPMDSRALTAGIQALVLSGEPHTAIATLEAFCSRADSMDLPSPRWTIGRTPVLLDVIAMNEIMVAFLRTGRPDVVFKLWGYMSPLYGVLPNYATLDIVLRSARLATRLDDSVKGNIYLAWQTLQRSNPFRSQEVNKPFVVRTRKDALDDITGVTGTIATGPRVYRSGLWDGMRAGDRARNVFLDILAGNFPQLKEVSCPARVSGNILATVKSEGSAPFFNHAASQHKHPHVIPTDTTFLSYLHLISVAPAPPNTPTYETEVPLLLAWMKELNIHPSRGTLATALSMFVEVESKGSPMWNQDPYTPPSSSSTPAATITTSSLPLEASLREERPPPVPSSNWLATLRMRTAATMSPYDRLVEFISSWVGPKNMPNQHDQEQWRRVLEKVRERARLPPKLSPSLDGMERRNSKAGRESKKSDSSA
ncbi:hypothetical protein BDV98DRAFT_570312 [Pterulicium gracile]|uniref:Uncharacterized protein n=1 Tax=Pterulicium gracile TaxID=1884261 RepID=A0A5C3QDU4_9AGAR|nr:hypothetical protein BDV98DRAFT_570312 [Pterula gracilis]